MSAAFGNHEACPLCMEPLDATERAVSFCSCGFNICRFCWKKLLESESGRCPQCRERYDESKVSLKSQQTEEIVDETANKKKKKKGDRKRGIKLTGQERKNLQDLRILQRNLVYAVGLSLDICVEKILAEPEFFGRYGPIKKISVNRSSPYSSGQSRNGPTGAAYVTFENSEDAAACVAAIDGTVWDRHYIRACFGTTKYCQAFLKGAQCNNPECLYMHHLVSEGTFTKEEMNSGFVNGQPELYNLINFDRSKGPVPGSLAKPPKGPGAPNTVNNNLLGGNSRRDSQSRSFGGSDSIGSNSDRSKGGIGARHEQDWPQLQGAKSNGRASCEFPTSKLEKGTFDLDKNEKNQILRRKSGTDPLWTVSPLKTQHQQSLTTSAASIPVPLQAQKKSLTLSSPVKVKMITNSRLTSGRSSSVSIPNVSLLPKLSTDSNLSQISLHSDEQNFMVGGRTSPPADRYVHPNDCERLRETKSATPAVEDLLRDRESIQAMLRRRTSVPEHVVDEATMNMISRPGVRRGPPPGFENRHSQAPESYGRMSPCPQQHLLQPKLSYDSALAATASTPIDAIQTLTQNLMEPAKNVDFTPSSLLECQTGSSMDCALTGQQFVGNLQSPFVANTGQQSMLSPNPNLAFPLSYGGDISNASLLQSLISTTTGLAMLQGANPQQQQQSLATHGSVPTMQNRLSADAIDRDVMTLRTLPSQGQTQDLATEQPQQAVVEEQAEAIRTMLQFQDNTPPQRRLSSYVQNTTTTTTGASGHPLNDPAILAFKKSGEQELVQMSLQQQQQQQQVPPNNLLPLKEPNNSLPSGGGGGGGSFECSGFWGADASMPITPFLMQDASHTFHQQQPAHQAWMDPTNGNFQNASTAARNFLYSSPGHSQMMDNNSSNSTFLSPDQVSSTHT